MSERTAQGSRSTTELLQRLADQISRLLRQELQLARLELAEKGRRTGLGAGLLGAAGLVALYGLAALVAAAILLLATAMPAWLAALVVALVLLALGGVLALVGRGQVRRATPPLPEQALAGIKADVRARAREKLGAMTSRARHKAAAAGGAVRLRPARPLAGVVVLGVVAVALVAWRRNGRRR